ncbi:MAG: hypothetical protein AAF744_09635 [Pseudomonadota bacterium]
MSAIILSNPYVPPTQASQQPVAEPQNALAVLPPAGAQSSAASGDATGYSGTGSGYGGGPGQEAILKEAMARTAGASERPTDATPASIVEAKAMKEANPLGTDLPEVDLPNPLPTSPILERMSEAS